MIQSMSENVKSFLEVIGISEGTTNCELTQDRGYDILVGGARFSPYDDHPRILVNLGNGLKSTAAGKFQILEKYYDAYAKQLDLPDFSPDSQDKIALQLIRECHASADIEAGNFDDAIMKCHSRWASFPGAGYGQHEQKMQYLRDAFVAAGGVLAVNSGS